MNWYMAAMRMYMAAMRCSDGDVDAEWPPETDAETDAGGTWPEIDTCAPSEDHHTPHLRALGVKQICTIPYDDATFRLCTLDV